MELKNKAGLALALAAIFTTGGANLALAADNVTGLEPDGAVGEGQYALDPTAVNPDTGKVGVQPGDNALLVEPGTADGFEGQVTITTTTAGTVTMAPDKGESIVFRPGTTEAVLSGFIFEVPGPGEGGYLFVTEDGKPLESVTVDRESTFGDATDGSGGGALPSNYDTGGNDLILEGGILTGENLTLGGGTLYMDPAWVNGDKAIPAARAAILQFVDKVAEDFIVDGSVFVGRNTQGAIGTDQLDWMSSIVSDTGKWSVDEGTSGYTAAFGLFAGQIMGADASAPGEYFGITVNGNNALAQTPANDTLNFADQSLFAVNLGNLAAGEAALAAETAGAIFDVYIGSDAANDLGNGIYFFNAATGTGQTVIDDVATIEIGGTNVKVPLGVDNMTDTAAFIEELLNAPDNAYWNVDFSSDLLGGTLTITKDTVNGGYEIGVDVNRGKTAQQAYGDMSDGMAAIVDALYGTDAVAGKNNVFLDGEGKNTFKDSEAGIAFVSRLTDNVFMPDHREATAVLKGAAQIAVAGGVPYLTNNVISKISGLIVDHNDLLNATQPAYGNEPGQLGIWVTPFYGMSDVDGMDAGRFENGFELNYGGAAFGLDYNVNEAFRLGVALNLGGGSSDSEDSGDFSNTENDFDFFGATLYGSYTNGAFGLTGDLGYTSVDNEIEQDLPAALGMGGRLHSNLDSDAFTVGLTGKYRFVAGENLNVAPHLGLRYTKIGIDDANVELAGGQRIFNSSVEDMNLFQIPLGVEFSTTTVTDGGWTVTPHADLGVLFTMGDTDVDTRATIPGTTYTGVMNADVVDSAAFTGTLGIKAQADNGLSLGLDYGILASGNQTDHQFTGMLRFEF